MNVKLDSRGWNTAHPDYERRVTPSGTSDLHGKRPTIVFWVVMVGLLIAGIVGLCLTTPVVGVG